MIRAMLAILLVGTLASVVVAGIVAGALQATSAGGGSADPAAAQGLADAAPSPDSVGPFLESISTFLSGAVIGIIAGIAIAHNQYQQSLRG
jgi:hypothetical protein